MLKYLNSSILPQSISIDFVIIAVSAVKKSFPELQWLLLLFDKIFQKKK